MRAVLLSPSYPAEMINFSRGLGTTMGQVARGGSEDDWFIGFNISRKFW